jgi:hypothetical protein
MSPLPIKTTRRESATGTKEFRSSRSSRSPGVQEFRSSGVQEFRSSGVQEFRSSGWGRSQKCNIKAVLLVQICGRLIVSTAGS